MSFTLIQTTQTGNGMSQILMLVAMVAVFYFFMIRPQSKKRKEAEKFRQNIAKGDRVITIGGIHGKVTSVNDTTVIIAVEEGAKLRIEKSAISLDASGIMTEETAKQAVAAN